MSGAHHFHVHGPHDHEVEHVAQHGASDSHAGQIAVVTAIIATVGAIFGYMAGATQANAGIVKNEAAIRKTEASNQWNYYQSKSSKQNLAELALELAPESRKAFYAEEVKRYKTEKVEIQKKAEELEKVSAERDHESEQLLHQHHRWAQAMTALQVAIALAAIALLTKRRWLEWGVYGVSAGGVALGALAALHI